MTILRSAMSALFIPFLLLTCASVNAPAQEESRTITLSENLQIPGAVLKPGSYTFSIEDRLKDRAIVRITSTSGNKHYVVLSVPSDKLSGQAQNGLILFKFTDDKAQVLRGWVCPGCSRGLEFVYPKLDAVKITDNSTESVLAVDPEYDKLPAKLSPDDMKVVTLWLLSPERITASNKGKGVKAEKYSGVEASGITATAQPAASAVTETAPAQQTPGSAEMASAASPSGREKQPQRRMPKTASNTFSLALWGLLSFVVWAGLHYFPRRVTRRHRG